MVMLERKHTIEQRVLYEKHKKEFEVARQEHADAKAAFSQEESALIDGRKAKLRGRDQLEAERQRKRVVFTAMPGRWSVFDEQLAELIQYKRMKLENDGAVGRGGEELATMRKGSYS